MSEPALSPALGDAELAARLVDELGVATSAGATADTGWGEYLAHLGGSLMRAAAGFLFRVVEALPLPAGWPRVLAVTVVGAALVLLVVVVVRAVLARRRKRREAEAGSPEVIVLPDGGRDPAPERDAAAWRAELEAQLAAGRVAEALAAAWWWLARALAGERADPSWTGRELLAHSGRRDLLPVVRRLEAFTYGGRRPAPAELSRLADDLIAGVEGAAG